MGWGALSSAAHPFEFRSSVRVIEVMGLQQRVRRGDAFGSPHGAEEEAEREEERGNGDGYNEGHSNLWLHRNQRRKSMPVIASFGISASCRTEGAGASRAQSV
jgi:hypothetical protein